MSVIHNLSVKEVYDKISKHFDVSRQRVWGSVKQFIGSMNSGALVLDCGCGNGKNMLYRKDVEMVGVDISSEQVRICIGKGLNASVSNITSLDFDDCYFDYMLCIATYHHIYNDKDRALALNEMYRCLKPGGKLLLTVWAMEQPEDSTFHFTKSDELVPWKSKDDGNTYLRYYHIYKEGELYDEIKRLCPDFTYMTGDWELGNWYCILERS